MQSWRLALLALCLAGPARAAELKLATWNLEWLTARGTGLPRDVRPKSPEDIEVLRGYAQALSADVVAVQEVDGAEILARIFPPERYALHLTADRVVQRVGFAVRRGLDFTVNPDLAALDLYPDAHHRLRSGADITLELPGGRLRLLAVHLKSGCRQDRLSRSARPECETLRGQLPPLQGWIAQRRAEGVAFALLGDFNRWMDGRDELLAGLQQAGPLARPTEAQTSPCWGGGGFIDHILAGGAARFWLVEGSLRVLVYKETGAAWKERLSDHCPVSARLRLPD